MLILLQNVFSSHPFAELAFLVLIVIIISYVMKFFKQPLLIGYILAGIVVGPSVLGLLQQTEQVQMFSHLGVALLLFMVGLGLNPALVKELGKASLIVGVGQVVFTTLIGIGISLMLGYDWLTSLYVSIALAFSSTIIIVKLLSDKGSLDELYGKISIGMLIVQDIIAMILLMVLSSLPEGGVTPDRGMFSLMLIGKMAGVIIVTVLVTKYVLPSLLGYIAKSTEFLLIFALGRCLLFAAGMELIGFSLEIGALIAGLTLATLPYRYEIGSRIKSLRDFFIMMFFVLLGSQLSFDNLGGSWLPIAVFTLFVLIGNPFIVMVLMGYLGYKKKNGMMVGFTVAQISEFSFILMALGLSLGHIANPEIVSMVTLIGLLTIAGSSYYFTHADSIFEKIKPFLSIFERKTVNIELQFHNTNEQYDIIVFGNHRTGTNIVEMLQRNNKNYLIVDYDPTVITQLTKKGIPCKYADASDIDILEEIALLKPKMVVSTIHDFATNMLLISAIKKLIPNILTIFSARNLQDAEHLYEQGADYVIVPHIISGKHTAMLIESYEYDLEKYAQHKQQDYNLLK